MSTIENNYQETDLGNVSLNPRGEYDPGASYEYLDTVSYQGGSYTCLAELGTTITGTAPDPGRNTDAWQMLTLPGDLTPEYIAMHDNTVNHARQAESSRLAAELAQQAAEDAQADVQQLHTDTCQAATEAGQSRDSAAGYAQSADASRRAAAESEQNINAQVTGFDTKVSESVTQAQEEIAATRQQAIRAVASQQVTSTQAVKDQTASYITEKETSAKTEIGNYTSEKVAEINNKASEANITLANTIADGTSLKTQLETTISTADTSKKNLDASDTAAGKTKIALDVSNATATKTKADLDASNTTASEAKTGLDATNKTAADLVVSLGDKITEGTRVKTDIQTTGETAMSNLQAEAAKQQEFIKTSIDDTLSISGKAADAAVTGKKIDSLKEEIADFIYSGMQYVDSATSLVDTLWRNMPNGLVRATGFNGFTTFSPFSVPKGTYYISKKIWHQYSWAAKRDGNVIALHKIDNAGGDEYRGVITFTEDVVLYITIKTANLPLMIVDGNVEPSEYHDKGIYDKSVNGEYKVNKHTLSEIETMIFKDFSNVDYFFVKDGKLVCNNNKRTTNGDVAKYVKVDMGENVKKSMCKFTARGSGNVTLITTPLDTDNNVQNIVNKSIHCSFGIEGCNAVAYLNTERTIIGFIGYQALIADDKTEYECGFEVVDDNTLRLYPPIGQPKDFTFDLTDYVGRNFIFETYCNNPPITDRTTYLWERMSILSVYCKTTSNHCLRDKFANYADGQTLLVAPSGHVYTNFRNVNADDGKYVNTNGANND